MKKIVQFLRRFNPRDLAKEVHVYGYDFSWRAHMWILLCSLLGIGAIGILFKLKVGYFAGILVVVIAELPVFILNSYRRMFEQKRFADAVTYAEQMLYSFQKSEKVLASLKETQELFEEGRMRATLEEAIEYLEAGVAQTESGASREALAIIEKAYSCIKVRMVHELLISSEEYGGDIRNSILLLLNDIELWKRRGYQLQANKKTSHANNIISIAVATILCAVALYVLNAMGEMFPGAKGIDIFAVEAIQLSSFGFILFMLYVLAKSMKSLTTNCLQSEVLHEEAAILASYQFVKNYNEAREKKKGIFFAVPFWGVSRVGYRMARKDVNEELYIALPQWLMEIALLLQNNNVQVSIAKSIQEAPSLLRAELILLMERLQKEPEKLLSYTAFCKDFDVPEVQSAMKMLHAISESGTGNAKAQIGNLIQRVQEMQNMADDIRNKNMAFRMKMIFSYPVLAATGKLLIDLTVGMIYMFQLLGKLGGM